MILVVGWIFCAGIIALTVILTIILSISVDDSNRFSKEQLQKPQLTKEEFKGHEGEKITARYLEKINGYKHIMNNVIINDNGKTRQIDHIAITENGIFIIETKNFSGQIYGREYSNEWKVYLGKNEYAFQNPIRQNFAHTEKVKKLLQDKNKTIYSVVVFARTGKLKAEVSREKVMYMDELKEYIESKIKVLNNQEIDEIYKILNDTKVTNEEYLENHNYNVQRYIQGKKDKINNGICIKCNGKLVKREGPYGEFYGCSNFPKCKYKIKIYKNNEI